MSYVTMGLAVLFLGRIIQSERRSIDFKVACRKHAIDNNRSNNCSGLDTL